MGHGGPIMAAKADGRHEFPINIDAQKQTDQAALFAAALLPALWSLAWSLGAWSLLLGDGWRAGWRPLCTVSTVTLSFEIATRNSNTTKRYITLACLASYYLKP